MVSTGVVKASRSCFLASVFLFFFLFFTAQLSNRGEISPVNLRSSPVATNLSEMKLWASATGNNRFDKPNSGGGSQIAFLIAGMWKVLILLSAPGELYAACYSFAY